MVLNRPRTLLFAGAHPDDETFGAGGTLAQYAAAGVKVYYACATRGEAGSVRPGYLRENTTIGETRWAELKCAAGILRLADVIHLGYRDSGMPGSEDNKHPDALVMAPIEQVVERLVRVIPSAGTGIRTTLKCTTLRSRRSTPPLTHSVTRTPGLPISRKSCISMSFRAPG